VLDLNFLTAQLLRGEITMTHDKTEPRTFVEMVLVLFEDRFPWLGSDQPVIVSDTVDQMSGLYRTLLARRSEAQHRQVSRIN
jgi:hypothetical protein